MKTKIYDVVIVGGGASGLACAISCARQGLKVVVLEKNPRVAKKVIASGNGRCNISNSNITTSNYNSSFVSDIITRYNTIQIIDFFESIGLLTKQEEGRIYPYSFTSNSVVSCLLSAIDKYGVLVQVDTKVTNISKQKDNNSFIITTDQDSYIGHNVVICSGSKATFGESSYNLVSDFGHKSTTIQPALTPLLTTEFKKARGVRAKVNATLELCDNKIIQESGELLFKEDSISGVLSFVLSSHIARQIVSSGNGQSKLNIDFVPDLTLDQLQNFIQQQEYPTMLQGIVHSAIANIIISNTPMDRSLMMTPFKAYNLAQQCKNYTIQVQGLGNINNAQVVSGGIVCDDFDSKTLQSKLCRGLYACGEVLNIDGDCGGYNLHWAWASGLTVADSIANQIKK